MGIGQVGVKGSGCMCCLCPGALSLMSFASPLVLLHAVTMASTFSVSPAFIYVQPDKSMPPRCQTVAASTQLRNLTTHNPKLPPTWRLFGGRSRLRLLLLSQLPYCGIAINAGWLSDVGAYALPGSLADIRWRSGLPFLAVLPVFDGDSLLL